MVKEGRGADFGNVFGRNSVEAFAQFLSVVYTRRRGKDTVPLGEQVVCEVVAGYFQPMQLFKLNFIEPYF